MTPDSAPETAPQPIPADPDERLAWAAELNSGTLMERLGITWTSVANDRVIATMPVRQNTQPFGLLHGGATSALIESAASLGATIAAGDAQMALCIDISVHHLRSVQEGAVIAVATPRRDGSTVAVWDVSVTDEAHREIATGRCTFSVQQR